MGRATKGQRYMFLSAVVLGAVGYLLSLFVIRPAVDGNVLPEGLNVMLINLAMLPCIFLVLLGLYRSWYDKTYLFAVLNLSILTISGALIWYFSYPIVHPPIGL